MTELVQRDSGAPLARQGRTVTVQLCTYDAPTAPMRPVHPAVDFPGVEARDVYREQIAPGAVSLADPVHVTDFHGAELIGRALPETLREGQTGPVVDVHLAETSAGNDMVKLLEADVIRSVSMEFAPAPGAGVWTGDLLTRSDITVHGLAFAFRPAHTSPVLAVREEQPKGDTMTTEAPAATLDRGDITTEIDATVARSIEQLEETFRGQLAELGTAAAAGGAQSAHPLAEFDSFGAYARRAYDDPDVAPLLWRVLADQITANNDGVILPTWVKDIKRIVDQGRPTISAFGTLPLPSSGMELSWPYTSVDMTTLVGNQATEKSDITSVQVDIDRGTAAIKTYAGGSDISLQLVMRSDPSYMDAYMRIMAIGYGAATDTAAAAEVATASGTLQVFDWATPGTGNELRTAVGIASRKVQTATGQPGSFLILPTANFDKLWAMTDFQDSAFPVQNTPGAGNAASLQFFVSGLPVIHDPYMAEAVGGIVSNSVAWKWNGQGPMAVEAADVEKLGRNVALWGLGVGSPYVPTGIVQVNAV